MRGNRRSERGPLLLAVALAAATFGALWALSDGGAGGFDLSEPIAWSRRTEPELAMLAALRLLGLVLSAWLLATSGLYALAVRSRHQGLRRVVGWFTLTAIRGLVERAAVVSITASSVLGGTSGAWAADGPPVTSGEVVVEQPVVRDGPAPSSTAPPTSTSTTSTSTAPPSTISAPEANTPKTDLPPPAPDPEPPGTPPPTRTETLHVVEPGESFWLIAERLVAERRGSTTEALGPADVRETWVELVEANRATIRSGNPNLIYPGEVLTLPTA